MDRETKQIEAAGHSFVVKTYLTALEQHQVQQAYFKGTKIELVGDQPKLSDFNPGVAFEVQQEMIRQVVVTMDGTTENIVERCLQLPSEDFDTIVAQLDALVAKKKK